MAQLYFRQLLAGRDFGRQNPVAAQMQNFVYAIGDRDTSEAVLVDPAWAVDDLVDVLTADGMKLTGALCTHYHPDHVGGTMFGFTVEGLPRLMAKSPVPVHCHKLEAEGIRKVTGLSDGDLVKHDGGDRLAVGGIEIELLHTPGHTPGSICFRLSDALVAGDTLFLQGCGRVDLPGGDPAEMYRTLKERLGGLAGDTMLYPGHAYGGEQADLATVRRVNQYLDPQFLAQWAQQLGLS